MVGVELLLVATELHRLLARSSSFVALSVYLSGYKLLRISKDCMDTNHKVSYHLVRTSIGWLRS